MLVCTYYTNIDFKEQEKLIQTWKTSWENKGFRTLILTLDHAKKCPYYEEFLNKIVNLHLKITNTPLKKYGIACYLRWLAYASLRIEESFLVSDYDLINHKFTLNDAKQELTTKFTLLDRYCPSIALGNSQQYLNFTKQIIKFSEESVEQLAYYYKHYKLQTFHDQDFLWLIHKIQPRFNYCDINERLFTPLDINIPTLSRVHLFKYDATIYDSKLVHVSNDSVSEMKTHVPAMQTLTNGAIKNLISQTLL